MRQPAPGILPAKAAEMIGKWLGFEESPSCKAQEVADLLKLEKICLISCRR
jgi:hypothetical protein